MSERPAAVKRLDALFSASMITHEAIFEICLELVAEGRGSEEQIRLLEESARITTGELPTLGAVARELAAMKSMGLRWDTRWDVTPGSG